MRDHGFAQFPAQQDRFPLYFAGEVEQSDVEIFDLHSSSVNLGESILYAANRLLALGLAPRQMDHIQQRATVEKNAVRCRL